VEILGLELGATSYQLATRTILNWAMSGESRYICIANVHVLMEAWDSETFRHVVNQSDLVTPDGMPLVWMMRLKGQSDQQRVYGPTLMLYVLSRAAKEGIPVGFYGGSPDVLRALIERMKTLYPGIKIPFFMSPPFMEMSNLDDGQVVEKINRSGTRILFVGLGCPKQETWMAEHIGRVNAVMLGVGAAFDFHAGVKPQAPAWMQNVGLEWLFRLLTEPRRLWKRYLLHNPRFVALAIADLLGLVKRMD
jgi:N-acetylglucosaminyldiphosphoundecaprenol N-acetyl-beta-D-mannosaminyltransferase